jgi:hypothetical protein
VRLARSPEDNLNPSLVRRRRRHAVHGSKRRWYQNALKNPAIRIDARDAGAEFRTTPITDAKVVKSVIDKFREKYGAEDVKKYYLKSDVVVRGTAE